jgi:hypothetical protein
MNKNPYIYNPVAKSFIQEHLDKIFENENVDQLLVKVADNALNAFKIITFDLAPKRDRNPDAIRVKLSDITNSNNIKELTAKLLDYADDNDLSNSKFYESKKLYLDALGKFCDALKRTSEISKAKDEVAIKQFKLAANKLMNSIDNAAKQAEEEEKKANENLDLYFFEDALNESIFTGYKDRLKDLKKLLTNLKTSAEGKDQKNGYGKDWKMVFVELDEKRKTLDVNEGGEKSRKLLEELEKQVAKYQEEFNDALIKAANKTLQKLEQDEEIYTTYSDVTELVNQAIEFLTRAKTQYLIVIKDIKDDNEAKELEISKTLFPLKRGDTDSDKKIKNSGLIFAVQKAFVDGIPSAGKLLKSKGGPNGKFGPATTSIVATLQKITGNKNQNGELDRTLLGDIISSDWVSDENKRKIQTSLEVIKSKTNENHNYLSKDDHLFEGKIQINQSEFEVELAKKFDEVKSMVVDRAKGEDVSHKPGSASGVGKLAKKLRELYNIKVEEDNFVKSDGSLKSSYTTQFIKDWISALDKAEEGDPKEFGYFFTNGGIYNINQSYTSLKNACNWPEWTEFRKIKSLNDEDATDFLTNYLKGWTTFGMIRPAYRYEGLKTLSNENASNESLDLSGAYEMMGSSIKNGEVPFVSYEDLKGDIAKAFKMVLQKDEKSPDLGKEEFVAINNFLIMIGNCVSFDGDEFISCVKWLDENVIGESTAKRIAKDQILGINLSDDSDSGPLLGYESSRIVVGSLREISKKETGTKRKRKMSPSLPGLVELAGMKTGEKKSETIKDVLSDTCYYIAADIYPSIQTHLRRMNAQRFDQVPQVSPNKCINVTK